MADLKTKMLQAAARKVGVPVDGSLTELVAWVNETFGLGATVDDLKLLPDTARDALLDLAASADCVVKLGCGQIISLKAKPEGKPPVTALVVLGA